MAKILTLQDAEITLTMPDGSERAFTLAKPNGENPYWWRMIAEAPGGQRLYKDPSRTRQSAFADYYPEFHFSYGHHRMFTTLLLVAKNIALKTAPPFDNPRVTDCLLANAEAVKNYLAGMAVASDAAGSHRAANPVPSGELELVFIGREPLSWQQALEYEFYQEGS